MSMAIDTSRNLQVIRNATYGTLGDNTAPRQCRLFFYVLICVIVTNAAFECAPTSREYEFTICK